MGYKKLVFVAPAWREELDEETDTLYLRADLSSTGACELTVTPVPGTDPLEYVYSCSVVTCEGTCDLRSRKLPDGTLVYECVCMESATTKASTATKSSRGKTAKKPKAAGGKGKKPAGKQKRKR